MDKPDENAGKKHVRGRPFKKGNQEAKKAIGISKGRNDVKESRKLNNELFSRLVNQYMNQTHDELKSMLDKKNRGNIPAIDLIVINVLVQSFIKGDHVRLNFLMDRMIGKVSNNVKLEHSGSIHAQLVDLINGAEEED